MPIRIAVILALAIALIQSARSADATVPADKSNFHVFVLMGQSNMAGTATPILPEDAIPSSNVLTLDGMNWRPASTPLEAKRGSGSCPGQGFARHYAALHPGVTVGLIQCARGARGLKELAKGGKDRDGSPNYDQNLERIRAAMKVGTIKGVLWHQGETDSGDPTYVDRLAAFVKDLREDIGDPQLPFIAGELGRFAPWTANFNKQIPRAATAIPRAAVISAEGLRDLGDRVHFSGFSAEVQGARYLMEYLRLAEPARVDEFKPKLEAITTAMLAREAAWDVILNGDMAEPAGTRPFGWDGTWTGKGKLILARDTDDSASAPASLRIASEGGPALGAVSQPLRDVAGKGLRISAKLKNAGFTSVRVTVTGIDGNWKQVFDKSLIDATAAGAWTPFTAEVDIPKNAINCRISLVVDGNGKAWLDDVVVERK